MIKAYYTAANGATGCQNYLDIISNNMANIQTQGFKKSKPEFSDLIYTNIKGPEGADTELKSGSGSKINKVDVGCTLSDRSRHRLYNPGRRVFYGSV